VNPLAGRGLGGDGEPVVRIGIVLPQDGRSRLHLDLPDGEYALAASGPPESAAQGLPKPRRLRNASLECQIAGTIVRVAVDGEAAGTAEAWSLGPAEGAGPAIEVADIVAGRGFHWQTITRQRIPGSLAVRNLAGALLLTARLPLEEYLAGVITAEMSGRCPLDFLKAQCVVARSWTLAHTERKHEKLGVDFCNDDCCQRYQGLGELTEVARRAVAETRGEVLVVEPPLVPAPRVVDANYSKSCGGITEAPEAIWGMAKPGLTAVVDAPPSSPLHGVLPLSEEAVGGYVAAALPGCRDAFCGPGAVAEAELPAYLGRVDTGGGFFRWSVSREREELEELLRRKGYAPADLAELTDLVVTDRGTSGRATAVEVAYRTAAGQRKAFTIRDQYAIRDALHETFLYSSAFAVRVEPDPLCPPRVARVRLDGAGWGHGVGLCQIGALGMALAGWGYRGILRHYFPTAGVAAAYA